MNIYNQINCKFPRVPIVHFYGQAFTRRLGKEVKKSLAEDRRRWADKTGAEVEAMVKA